VSYSEYRKGIRKVAEYAPELLLLDDDLNAIYNGLSGRSHILRLDHYSVGVNHLFEVVSIKGESRVLT
jgi:hypothetical protein